MFTILWKLLKDTGEEIAQILAEIYESSLDMGEMSDG